MKNSLVTIVVFIMLPLSSVAQEAAPPPRQPASSATAAPAATLSSASRAVWDPGRLPSNRRIAPQPDELGRPWISRHPVLFGALVGAGAGAVSSAVQENELFCSRGDEDCFFHGSSRFAVGAGIGAGIGAAVGLVVGIARK
jgi:hypothetical protein